MKTTDFIKENELIGQDAHDMHQDHQHQMLREECYHIAVNSVALHKLLKQLPEHIPLDAWAAEKISLANDYLKTVKEWLEYDVMGAGKDVPSFNPALAESKLAKALNEVNPHNYDSDEDYYNDLHGSDEEEFDGDVDDFDDEPANDEESHYEKSLRVRGLGEQSVAEVTEQGTKMSKTCARCGGSLFRFPNTIKCQKCNQTWKASPKTKEQGVAEGKRTVKENASAGATGASSVAVSMTQEGNYPAEMVARQKTYSNQRTKGGTVKIKADKK